MEISVPDLFVLMVNEITQAIGDKPEEECARLVPDFVTLSKQHFAWEEALLA